MQQPKMLLCLVIACLGIAQAEMLTTDISTRGSDEAFMNVSNAWLFPRGAAVLDGTAFEIAAGEENLWVSSRRGASGDRDSDEMEDASGVSRLIMLVTAGGDVSESALRVLSSVGNGRGERWHLTGRFDRSSRFEPEDGSSHFGAVSDDDRAAARDLRPASRPFEVAEPDSQPTAPMFSDQEQAPPRDSFAEAGSANTPEPSTMVLIALGIALIGARKLRRA